MGDYSRAIEDYDQSIKLKSDFAKPFNNRGVAYRKVGDYERAIKDFDSAIKLDSGYALAFANRAEAYRSRSEEHTSELQSYSDLVCRLLLEKKKKKKKYKLTTIQTKDQQSPVQESPN